MKSVLALAIVVGAAAASLVRVDVAQAICFEKTAYTPHIYNGSIKGQGYMNGCGPSDYHSATICLDYYSSGWREQTCRFHEWYTSSKYLDTAYVGCVSGRIYRSRIIFGGGSTSSDTRTCP